MPTISVVIITKNEALNIAACIASAKRVSNDIVVLDTGSTDTTVQLAKNEHVRVESIAWNGYGNARNTGASLASNEWILSLDADERVTDDLAATLATVDLSRQGIVYGFNRVNFFGNTEIKHGALGHDRIFRLYNKTRAQWNLVPVHEKLIGQNIERRALRSYIEHYGIRSAEQYQQKKASYAFLCALKYKQEKKKFISAMRLLSPPFNFIKAYIFQLGFLDKRIGFFVAKANAHYTSSKYRQLYSMLQEEKEDQDSKGFLVIR